MIEEWILMHDREKTIILFMGDNGTSGREATGGAGKGRCAEQGARVPCIVRGPVTVM